MKISVVEGYGDMKYLIKQLGQEYESNHDKSDCIIYTGGGDISPVYYNEKHYMYPDSKYHNSYQTRTDEEIELFNKYKGIKKFIGICRGHQLLNILHGGTLTQNLPEHRGYIHTAYDPEGIILGYVNSLHHQCINTYTGVPLVYSDENLIEAMYWKTGCLGVQWHPEMQFNGRGSFDIFNNLVKEYLSD